MSQGPNPSPGQVARGENEWFRIEELYQALQDSLRRATEAAAEDTAFYPVHIQSLRLDLPCFMSMHGDGETATLQIRLPGSSRAPGVGDSAIRTAPLVEAIESLSKSQVTQPHPTSPEPDLESTPTEMISRLCLTIGPHPAAEVDQALRGPGSGSDR